MIDQVEKFVSNKILPEIRQKGRKNFDYRHTKAVVCWIKKIISEVNNNLDDLVLITAAYAHDWGYVDLFKGIETNLETITNSKKRHMLKGGKMIKYFLQKDLSSFFSKKQIERVSHLVKVHDQIEALKEEDEIILMEADTLGMLDVKRVKPTFSKTENKLFMEREIYGRRLLHFKHAYALKVARRLAKAREQYYLTKNSLK